MTLATSSIGLLLALVSFGQTHAIAATSPESNSIFDNIISQLISTAATAQNYLDLGTQQAEAATSSILRDHPATATTGFSGLSTPTVTSTSTSTTTTSTTTESTPFWNPFTWLKPRAVSIPYNPDTDLSTGITWGCAFKVSGTLALDYLRQRECTLGGYLTDYIKFFPRLASEHSGFSGEAFPALVYIATPKNELWIGEEPLVETARQIASCRGPSGHNVEYLIRLAVFMREELPGASDEHLFELEGLVRRFVAEANLSIAALLGSTPRPRIRRDSHENVRRHVSFEYTSRVPEKKLRCLHI